MEKRELGQCVVCDAVLTETLPCGHWTCDECLESYMLKSNSDPSKRLTFNHLYCPQRCGCFIGDHFVRNRSDEEKAKMQLEVSRMNKVHELAVAKLDEEFPDSRPGELEIKEQECPPVEEKEPEAQAADETRQTIGWLVAVFLLLWKLLFTKKVKESEKDSVVLTVEENKVKVELDVQTKKESRLEEAMRIFSYYQCNDCTEILYGGLVSCEAADQGAENLDDDEEGEVEEKNKVLCNSCFCKGGQNTCCDVHGSSEMEFKCMFCCHPRPVTYLCGGVDYYCDECHKSPGKITNCDPLDCIWGGRHPEGFPSGIKNKRYSLGCSMCRNTGGGAMKVVYGQRLYKVDPEDLLREFFRRVDRQSARRAM